MVSFPEQSNIASYALGTGAVSRAAKAWSSNNKDGSPLKMLTTENYGHF
jgi:hypothetical protein